MVKFDDNIFSIEKDDSKEDFRKIVPEWVSDDYCLKLYNHTQSIFNQDDIIDIKLVVLENEFSNEVSLLLKNRNGAQSKGMSIKKQ